ncbi:MbcA/ParS/Xre antitoxin family protein [Glaciimonas immobilis]|uniref:Antitoxin Xre/MbcA/ParS-like toxin-binding domain-containing protein n=1 Tax=Glaciimonas immobilis TaxID=728004 RepID=A0A840RRX5_9BURK|nr:MbcA/ParS/Xre antitoxin family protein [Glaciimonas immobilis]KAF3999932.1 DUF2384 domain-containing protein [Glaciimonas immobilis]MBB5200433.1 hypothetical protein [Glaciimonas immobilis]
MPNRNNARTGEAFWRCSSRRCHTKTRANYDRDSIGDTVSAAEPSDCKIDSAISSATSSATSSAIREVKFEDRNRTEAIVRRTVIEFGNKEAAIKWLQAKKVGLRGYGDTPLEAIKSVLGCTLVDALLDQRFET